MNKPFQQRVKSAINDISGHTRYGAVYYDFDDSTQILFGQGVCRFCLGCTRHTKTALLCRNSAVTSAVQGHAIGDSWYFRCWLGVDSIAIPIAPDGDVVGALEIGGFFSPGGTEQAQQVIMSRLASVAVDDSFEAVIRSMQGIRELDFQQVKAIADFALAATFTEGLNNEAVFTMRRQISRQQERLAARIGRLQTEKPAADEKMVCLCKLQTEIQNGERRSVLKALDDYLGYVLLEAEQSRDIVRGNILLLASLLFHEGLKKNMSWTSHIHEYERQVAQISQADAIETLCFWAENAVLKQFAVNGGQLKADVTIPPLSERLLAWIRRNYRHKITIADAANEVGACVSAITHCIKQETGSTFLEHLNGIRVSEAKRLLAYSNLSLAEISLRCGFSDQSYFTKVFRKTINLTPSMFRKLLDNKEMQDMAQWKT